jgi:signal transduction histidine kinase
VPDKVLPKLFAPFYRGPQLNNNQNGTGLGLAIARRVFEIHGGTATAANADGGGFIVSLELPLYEPASVHQPEAGRRPTTEEHGNAITAA